MKAVHVGTVRWRRRDVLTICEYRYYLVFLKYTFSFYFNHHGLHLLNDMHSSALPAPCFPYEACKEITAPQDTPGPPASIGWHCKHRSCYISSIEIENQSMRELKIKHVLKPGQSVDAASPLCVCVCVCVCVYLCV